MGKRTCSVEGCVRDLLARGYCQLHYGRWRKHGDPLMTLKGLAHKVKYTVDGLRICKACGVAKPESDFHKASGGSDGLRAQCKPCRSSHMAGYYTDNREAKVAYERQRRVENLDSIRAWDRERYARERGKRIALASESVHIRRARLAGAETDVGITVRKLKARDGGSCCYCLAQMCFVSRVRSEGILPHRATLEHVVPISRGGSHLWGNVALACHLCNTSKGNKTVDEWIEWKAGVPVGWEETVAAGEVG